MFIHTPHHARSTRARQPAADGRGLAGLALVGLLTLAGCGDDTPEVLPTEPGASTLEVTMADFGYGGVPDVIISGTEFTVRNDSETELHELVAVRLADDDDRPVAEIVESDLDAVLSAGPPSLVVLAEPGSDSNIVAVGDGALHEPGRYLFICAIPTGVDPAAYLQAAAESNGEKPDVEGGPPHFLHGMYADVEVIPA